MGGCPRSLCGVFVSVLGWWCSCCCGGGECSSCVKQLRGTAAAPLQAQYGASLLERFSVAMGACSDEDDIESECSGTDEDEVVECPQEADEPVESDEEACELVERGPTTGELQASTCVPTHKRARWLT